MAKLRMYTTPIICKYKNEWFVFFRFWNNSTGKYVAKKISRANGNDLNRLKDLKQREREFNALRKARETWLQLGWDPIADPDFKQRYKLPSSDKFDDINEWTVTKALLHALQYKKLAKKSKYDYKKSVEYFLQAAGELCIDVMQVSTLTRTHVKAVFAYLSNETKLPPKNYNKRLCHIKSLFSELEEWRAITENPAYGIKELIEEQTEKFVPYTEEERNMIKEYLYVVNYRFFVFWATIYYTGIRPDEILSMRIKDLDLETNTMHLKPFSNVVKNKKERYTAVHEDLARYYKEMNLQQLPQDYYIFSKKLEPGPTKTNAQVPTLLWKKLVQEELGIKKYMYAGKHSGATAFIKAGASEENIVDHLGHSSRFISRMYTQEGVRQSQKVIAKTKVVF